MLSNCSYNQQVTKELALHVWKKVETMQPGHHIYPTWLLLAKLMIGRQSHRPVRWLFIVVLMRCWLTDA